MLLKRTLTSSFHKLITSSPFQSKLLPGGLAGLNSQVGGGAGACCSRDFAVNASSSSNANEEDAVIFPVTGHRLMYGEFGEPNAVIRKETGTIDGVKPGQVKLII